VRALLVFFILYSSFFKFNAQIDTLKPVNVVFKKERTPPKPYTTINLDSSLNKFDSENLSDLLNKETSLYIKEYGSGMLSTLSIRGANSGHTKLYWNGIPINSPTLGQTDLNIIPVSVVNDVTIHQGAGSIVDGTGGIGGSLQLNNQADWDTPNKFHFYKKLGSFGLDKSGARLQLSSKNIQNQTGVFHNETNNNYLYTDLSNPDKSKKELENAFVFLYGGFTNTYFKKGTFNASVKANYTNSFRELPAVIGAISTAIQKDENKRIVSEVNKYFKKDFIQFRSGFILDKLEYSDTTSGIQSEVVTSTFANNLFFKHKFTDSVSFEVQSNNYNYLAISTGFAEDKNQLRNQVLGLFQHQTKFIYYTLSAQILKIDSIYSPFMYSVGIEKGIKDFALKASYAKTFNYPTLNDLFWNPGGNINLKPEEGLNSDLSIQLKKEKLRILLTGFYANTNNLIQWIPQENGIWSPINIKNVIRKGVELSAQSIHQFKRVKIKLNTNYTFVDAITSSSSITNDETIGKQQIYIPKHKIVGKVSFMKNNFEISYNQQYTSKVYIDATNTTYLPWYSPADIEISYKFSHQNANSKLTIGAYNIYNEEYQIVANRPMPLRHFAIRIVINLNGNEVQ